jgi:chromosomal replication initiation ATPase DnaA
MKRNSQLKPEDKAVVKQIVELVSEHTYIPVKDILGRSRRAELVDARHMVYYFVYKHQRLPVMAIARHFNLTHGAVIHALKNIGYRLILDKSHELRRQMEKVAEALKCKEVMEGV